MPYRQHLRSIITADSNRLRVLQRVRALGLPDCWVAAGFVRSAVWDHLHGRSSSPLPADIDVIWFDHTQVAATLDANLQAVLRHQDVTLDWSVKNQARMHLRNDDPPYASATDAMMHWPETATAVAIRLDADGELEIAAPFGLDDLFNLRVRPTPGFLDRRMPIYLDRLHTKRWHQRWPMLDILDDATLREQTRPAPTIIGAR